MQYAADPASVTNKPLIVLESVDLLVIGAGPAGVAAALEAQASGVSTMLVDENPIPFETAGEDVPFHFGGCMGGDLRNGGRTLEVIIEQRPDIVEVFEAGVDVRMGATALGLFVNGATVGWLPGNVALLSDAEKVWAVRFDKAIVATGRRDVGMAFPGWETPGVMGVTAASLLGATYKALDVRAFVMIGSVTEALLAAASLHELGHACLGIVEVASRPVGADAAAKRCMELGIPFYFNTRPAGVDVDASTGRLESLTIEGKGRVDRLACDAVILGIGVAPVIELLDVAGCDIDTDYARGGHVPRLAEGQRTSLQAIYAAGDCCGIWPAKSIDPEIARTEGRRAARQAAGAAVPGGELPAGDPGASNVAASRLAWFSGPESTVFKAKHVCQCEEVSARNIVEVQPPVYLNAQEAAMDRSSLEAILDVRTADPDQIKRLTRASMGPCQGRRCREQVECLLAGDADVPLAEVPRATYRYPVRPVPLRHLASLPEAEEITRHWDAWFGMPVQWTPYWKIQERYTASGCPRDSEDSE